MHTYASAAFSTTYNKKENPVNFASIKKHWQLNFTFMKGFLLACYIGLTIANLALGMFNIATLKDQRRNVFITMQADQSLNIENTVEPVDFVRTVAENRP